MDEEKASEKKPQIEVESESEEEENLRARKDSVDYAEKEIQGNMQLFNKSTI